MTTQNKERDRSWMGTIWIAKEDKDFLSYLPDWYSLFTKRGLLKCSFQLEISQELQLHWQVWTYWKNAKSAGQVHDEFKPKQISGLTRLKKDFSEYKKMVVGRRYTTKEQTSQGQRFGFHMRRDGIIVTEGLPLPKYNPIQIVFVSELPNYPEVVITSKFPEGTTPEEKEKIMIMDRLKMNIKLCQNYIMKCGETPKQNFRVINDTKFVLRISVCTAKANYEKDCAEQKYKTI